MNILLIDDEPRMGATFSKILQRLTHQVTYLPSGKDALSLTDDELADFDVVMIDMLMPVMDGCATGIKLKERLSRLVTIMLTGDSKIETVVKALRDSDFDDYLCKPDVAKDAAMGGAKLRETFMRADRLVKERRELENTKHALDNANRLNQVLRQQSLDVYKELIGTSASFQRVLQHVQQVAMSDATVLIRGETGTGKELVAKEIHKSSHRARAAFVPINCGSIPRDLLESELFGHKRGAFTGANSDREGFFQLANGGTLFLDEIGDMPLDLQVKLLRVLQEQEILPVGGSKPVKVNVRIVSATHQDLRLRIQEGKFREDLFYRLNVFPINIPPLRERLDDLEALIQHFIGKKAQFKTIRGIASDALNKLKQRYWQGNIRELENVVERAVLVATQEYLTPEDFPEDAMPPSVPFLSNEVPTSTVEVVSSEANSYEQLWRSFQQNDYQLWTIDNHESVKQELDALMGKAIYQKKGHFGQLRINGGTRLQIRFNYLSAASYQVEPFTIIFDFLSTAPDPSETSEKGGSSTQIVGPNTVLQQVLKGLPDTYLFDIFYQPAKRSDLSSISQQQLIRAILLRYAQTVVPSKSLKAVFEDTMAVLTEPNLVSKIEGLNKDGIEAIRACLCSKSHIFSGLASQLRVNPPYIEQEIRKVFPQYNANGI